MQPWQRCAFFGATLLATAASAEPDWSKIQGREIPLFYPGPTGLEWVMNNTDHTGARKLREKAQTCVDCHEEDADMIGKYIVTGKKVGKANQVIEKNVPPGRRGSFPLLVKAAHDGQKLYLRFEWMAGEAAEGPRPDPDNEVKLTVMFDTDRVADSRLAGCWMSCHMDLRSMPDASEQAKKHARAKALGWSDGVTKYLAESRTGLTMEGAPRGGWSKLRSEREIAAALKAGKFLDLMQYRSGVGQRPVDGYVLESRHMGGGKSLLAASGEKVGNRWAVTFERQLAGKGVGDHTIKPGSPITFGVAIHENHGAARFHQVSLGYTLGLDDAKAYINAVAAPANGQPANQ